MPDPEPNPLKITLLTIAAAAQAAGLNEFLLIGGHAVIFYGVPRFTQDVDFLIPADRHLDWRLFLESHGYRFGHGTPGFEQFFPASPGAPRIDLMLVDRGTWDKLLAASQAYEFAPELHLALPAPKHLIALKLSASVSPTRSHSAQDWLDVTELVRRCNLDLSDAELKALVVRYGGAESWERLLAAVQPQPSPQAPAA